MKSWKDWDYWLRGGFILGFIGLILEISNKIFFQIPFQKYYFNNSPKDIFIAIDIIIGILIGFLIGALIGWIYGKIKNKEGVRK